MIIHHCPSNCHTHVYQTFDGVAGGSFPAPDHEYPSYLEIQLTATDSCGADRHGQRQHQSPDRRAQFPVGRRPASSSSVGTSRPQVTPVHADGDPRITQHRPGTSAAGHLPERLRTSCPGPTGAPRTTTSRRPRARPPTPRRTRRTPISASPSTPSPEPVGAGATLTYTLNVANAGSLAGQLRLAHRYPPRRSHIRLRGGARAGPARAPGRSPARCPRSGSRRPRRSRSAVTAPAERRRDRQQRERDVVHRRPRRRPTTRPRRRPTSSPARTSRSRRAERPPRSAPASRSPTRCNVSNAGPSTATSVSVSDSLPAGAGVRLRERLRLVLQRDLHGHLHAARRSPTGAAPAITISITAPGTAGTATNSVTVSSATNDPAAGEQPRRPPRRRSMRSPRRRSPPTAVRCARARRCSSRPRAVAGATYAWTGPNGFTSSLQNPTIPGATPAASGLYSVTVTINACTSAAGTTTATVRALPTATVSGGGAICAGGATTISAALTGTGPWNVDLVRRRHAERRGRFAGDPLRQPRGHDHVQRDRRGGCATARAPPPAARSSR